ncbi:MAG: phosphoribosyltransferase family protein [Pseudomonadota bacterium]
MEIRFSNLSDAISATDRAGDLIAGQSIVLIDDVMTSGATLAACAEAAWKVGARNVQVLTLARAVKDPYIVPTAY